MHLTPGPFPGSLASLRREGEEMHLTPGPFPGSLASLRREGEEMHLAREPYPPSDPGTGTNGGNSCALQSE